MEDRMDRINTDKMVKLESSSDTESFLVPCYGFETAEQAIEYAAGPWPRECRIFDEEDAYAPIFWGKKFYVARVSARHNRWHTSALVGHSELRNRGDKAIWETLRGKDTVKPAGAYHVALLVAGKRQFYRHHRQTTKHPKWWYQISDGEKDCYAVWARRDGSGMGGAMFDDGDRGIFAARSARGVIYSCETRFDNRGEPCGIRRELVQIEFSILDRDPAKDDMLRVYVYRSLMLDDVLTEPSAMPFGSSACVPDDRVWPMLVEQAVKGFELNNCQPVPKGVEAWRKFFLDQRAKAEADRLKFNASFRALVCTLPWHQALDLVEEPWQLAAVINEHAHNPEFYDSPGYPGATYSQVGKMLEAYAEVEGHGMRSEQRAERCQRFHKMIADYIEPSDNLWDYTGD